MFNHASTVYAREWLAVVFDKRNQSYGAYRLRREADSTLTRALFFVSMAFIALFVAPLVYQRIHAGVPVVEDPVKPLEWKDVPVAIQPLKQEEVSLPEETPPAVKAPARQMKNFSAQMIVVEETQQEAPLTEELLQSLIGSSDQEGLATPGNSIASETANPGGIGMGTAPEETTNEVFNVGGVEVYPEFPGGMEAWAKFIRRHLRYPYMAEESGVQGRVFLSFVIEKDGSLSQIEVLKGIGAGCDEEAVRVIKKSPKWKPGKQNQQNVRVRYTMPIVYTLNK